MLYTFSGIPILHCPIYMCYGRELCKIIFFTINFLYFVLIIAYHKNNNDCVYGIYIGI